MQVIFGNTTNFVVSYDDSLDGMNGNLDGPALSQGILDYCEYDLARLSIFFGNIMVPAAVLPIQVQLFPGGGGGSNDLIHYIAINVGNSVDTPPHIHKFGLSTIVVAELAEIFMTLQAKGWIPTYSNGESLSRVLAQVFYPADAWFWGGNGWSWYNFSTYTAPEDWVNHVKPTDQDFVSIGCGALFLNYLAYQLNYTWPQIIAATAVAPNNTLAHTAALLNASPTVYNDFLTLLQTYVPGGIQSPSSLDDIFPLGPIPTPVPALYMRHNLADNGTSHSGDLSVSPDIIVKNNAVANPQATYSTPASIASNTQSDADVLDGQQNSVYLRVWNRGTIDAKNVFATVYWSPVSTLVTPDMWNLVGDTYYPNVPKGSTVEVSVPGIPWPSDKIPSPGHYCFVATVGNADAPAPQPNTFVSFQDFENYIAANNNITWCNFNVVNVPVGGGAGPIKLPHFPPFPHHIALPFLLSGAWDKEHLFTFETVARLPKGSTFALQVAEWVGRGLTPAHKVTERYKDSYTDPANRHRVRIALSHDSPHHLGEIELHKACASASHLLVNIPAELHDKPYEVAIRQMYKGREVGRVTWLLVPSHKH